MLNWRGGSGLSIVAPVGVGQQLCLDKNASAAGRRCLAGVLAGTIVIVSGNSGGHV